MAIKNSLKNIYCRVINFWPFFTRGAVVLMYHSISDNGEYFFSVKPSEFERQMQYLHDHKFNVVSAADLENCLQQGSMPPKTVVVTFDDGYDDNYNFALPILKKFNFSATVFLTTGLTASGRLKPLDQGQIDEMADSGLIDFEPHTVHHPKLTKLTPVEAETEITASREAVEKISEKHAQYFAYPYGCYSDGIIQLAKKLELRMCFTVDRGMVRAGDDKMLLKRNSVDSAVTMAQFKAMVKFGKI